MPILTDKRLQAAAVKTALILTAVMGLVGATARLGLIYIAGMSEPGANAVALTALLALAATMVGVTGWAIWVSIQKDAETKRLKAENATQRSAIAELEAQSARRLARRSAIFRRINVVLQIDYKYCNDLELLSGNFDKDSLERTFEQYVERVLTETAHIFKEYCGGDINCAASLKLLSKYADTKTPPDIDARGATTASATVWTLARDSDSRYQRKWADEEGRSTEVYAYKDNTAFQQIMHNPNIEGFYTLGKLNTRPREEYENKNPRWAEFYDEVAVAALKLPIRSDVVQALGFLCVDHNSKGAVKFDRADCRQILESIASVIYYSLQKTAMLRLNYGDVKA